MAVLTLSSVWYSSQLGTILLSLLALVSSSNITYLLAYFSIIISLVISLYQSLTAERVKNTPPQKPAAKAITANEKDIKTKAFDFVELLKSLVEPAKAHPTTPYVLLAIAYLIVCTKYKITLIPFVIFAFFHAVNYTRTFILPILPVSDALKTKGKTVFETINTNYHEPAFKVAVWIQLFAFATVTLWAVITTPLNLLGYGDDRLIINWLSVYIWYAFINVLQSENLLMKGAINEIITALDGIAADPRLPQNLRDNWAKVKHIIRNKDLNHSE